MKYDNSFWEYLQKIVDDSKIVIDRPKGTHHPDYPDAPAYPLDYGYLEGSFSMDGEGIDCFLGSLNNKTVTGILCTVDILKNDSEIKILIGCTNEDMVLAYNHLNGPDFFRALLVTR